MSTQVYDEVREGSARELLVTLDSLKGRQREVDDWINYTEDFFQQRNRGVRMRSVYDLLESGVVELETPEEAGIGFGQGRYATSETGCEEVQDLSASDLLADSEYEDDLVTVDHDQALVTSYDWTEFSQEDFEELDEDIALPALPLNYVEEHFNRTENTAPERESPEKLRLSKSHNGDTISYDLVVESSPEAKKDYIWVDMDIEMPEQLLDSNLYGDYREDPTSYVESQKRMRFDALRGDIEQADEIISMMLNDDAPENVKDTLNIEDPSIHPEKIAESLNRRYGSDFDVEDVLDRSLGDNSYYEDARFDRLGLAIASVLQNNHDSRETDLASIEDVNSDRFTDMLRRSKGQEWIETLHERTSDILGNR